MGWVGCTREKKKEARLLAGLRPSWVEYFFVLVAFSIFCFPKSFITFVLKVQMTSNKILKLSKINIHTLLGNYT